MLDFFSSKKSKKHHHSHDHDHGHQQHHDRHEAHHHDNHHHHHSHNDSPLLSPNDEAFLERIVSQDDGHPTPPSPPPLHMPGEPQLQEDGYPFSKQADRRVPTLPEDRDLDDEGPKGKHKKHEEHEKPTEKPTEKAKSRWSLQRFTPKKKSPGDGTVTPRETAKENDELAAVLDRLNLSSGHGRGLSLSKESREMVQQFNQILKDIVNGAPTAYDDLIHLFDSSQDHLEKSYGRLPGYLQKVVKTLPRKMSKSIAPELVATAAAAEGASLEHADLMGAAAKRSGVRMPGLKDLIMKPGAIATLLKSVMNTLKLRFPAFLGTSALWSLGVFVLLLALWYCHKRGREVRLAKEGEIKDQDRFEELDDDDDDTFADEVTSGGGAHSGNRALLPPPSSHSGTDMKALGASTDRAGYSTNV
ncbi:MAG: hypothetical protein M1816_004079 [Peltula sp. TS41687]|nr:MAG: hypothetical protein M1816_004079 [Peltula sp. TS41687]